MESVQFKTFAWMLPRYVWNDIAADMQSIAEWTSDELHPAFAGCRYCCTFCYDHLVEYLLRDRPFLTPDTPRATQRSRGGMTEFAHNATSNPIVLHAVPYEDFIVTTTLAPAERVLNAVAVALILALGLGVVRRLRGAWRQRTNRTHTD
jgi:hypothetical protein